MRPLREVLGYRGPHLCLFGRGLVSSALLTTFWLWVRGMPKIRSPTWKSRLSLRNALDDTREVNAHHKRVWRGGVSCSTTL